MQNNHAVILQACLKSIKNVHKKILEVPDRMGTVVVAMYYFFSRLLFTLYHR